MAGDANLVLVGRVSGFYGVKGWLKIQSFTKPRENILEYSPWQLSSGDQRQVMEVTAGRRHSKGIVARLGSCEDRDDARIYLGAEIAILRSQMPEPDKGEYYWTDLIGLRVVTDGGVELGRVDHLLETGSNDVLVVNGERERLIPFIMHQAVLAVDREQGLILVNWEPDF